ncbi:hypothetical protein PoB_004719500 [Plakobranchus ocellatus]|uniref:Uncharacterized protein n=1 Tax=Plakobranchus ocellatus TaxID=259542 RepID=A0AAV4BMN2_9GAST|nr:hypothetical protein PoB_004719500 [Plakobranchus ocellatus]
MMGKLVGRDVNTRHGNEYNNNIDCIVFSIQSEHTATAYIHIHNLQPQHTLTATASLHSLQHTKEAYNHSLHPYPQPSAKAYTLSIQLQSVAYSTQTKPTTTAYIRIHNLRPLLTPTAYSFSP